MSKQCTANQCDRPLAAKGYCHAHYRAQREGRPIGPLRTDPIAVRLPSLIDKSGECWEWLGHVETHGYGVIKHDGKARKAHRAAYEHFVGPIPEGLVLDHLCRNRSCVNPKHLEAVTQRVNAARGFGAPAIHARKTHCKHGHPFDEANTYIRPAGGRRCRTCDRKRLKAARANRSARPSRAATLEST